MPRNLQMAKKEPLNDTYSKNNKLEHLPTQS